jgi:RNA polymerase sigma-70 factor (ECF subfamily)
MDLPDMDLPDTDSPDVDSPDQSIIRAVLDGDSKAYRTLVVKHSTMVFRVAYRITQNEADAEEVVQETFLRGYQKLASFQADAAFGSWIYRIAVNCAYDLTTRNRRETGAKSLGPDLEIGEKTVEAADSAADPERLMLSSELGAQQKFALQALTPLERTAFLLRHVEEQSTAEIAAALGVGHSAAKQAVFRAVQKLRLRLAANARSKARRVGSDEPEKPERLEGER